MRINELIVALCRVFSPSARICAPVPGWESARGSALINPHEYWRRRLSDQLHARIEACNSLSHRNRWGRPISHYNYVIDRHRKIWRNAFSTTPSSSFGVSNSNSLNCFS